ncbi:hypothetical protein [Streptomyces sp. 6N223]|uniref:hypothetical protein n=1 Tax=Streptomyces sp. 6N223 TaxID=3457412 RepID=UPI003FD1042B
MSLSIAVADTARDARDVPAHGRPSPHGVAAFQAAQIKVVSPLVLAELDYLLMTRAGKTGSR